MGLDATAAILGGIAQRAGLAPNCELRRTDNGELEVNVEARKFTRGPATGWFLYNWDRYAKTFRLKSPALAVPGAQLTDPSGERRFAVKDGEATITLPPMGRQILVSERP